MKDKDLEDLSLQELWLEAYCRLVCPFPRLEAIRYMLTQPVSNLNRIDIEEYSKSVKEGQEYIERKEKARKLYKERLNEG